MRTDREHPWARAFVQWAGWPALAAGAVLCAIGWYGVSGERFVERQIPYLASCTVPGAALIVAGAILLARSEQSVAAERMEELHRLLVTYEDTDGGGHVEEPEEAVVGTPSGIPTESGRPPPENRAAPPTAVSAETRGRSEALAHEKGRPAAPPPPAEPPTARTEGAERPVDRETGPASGPALLAVPGGTLVHRPDCPLVAGKPQAFRASVSTGHELGLEPCPVCEPEFPTPPEAPAAGSTPPSPGNSTGRGRPTVREGPTREPGNEPRSDARYRPSATSPEPGTPSEPGAQPEAGPRPDDPPKPHDVPRPGPEDPPEA